MLQATALRVHGNIEGVDFAAPVVVAGEAHRFLVAEQLLQVEVQPQAIILEPLARNTALAVALAAALVAGSGQGDRLLLVMPSDHVIRDPAAFLAAIRAAVSTAQSGQLVTFGITPTEPATGYGYIQPVEAEGDVRRVRRFVEKPDKPTATGYVEAGYFWNSGIFLFRADSYLAELLKHAPAIADAAAACMQNPTRDGLFLIPHKGPFADCPSLSVDYAVMEHCAEASVVPVQMGWSDVGSWDALWQVGVSDTKGNVVCGDTELLECTGSLVKNEGGPLVACLGLDSMVVVSTADAVLVAPRSRSEDVRKMVQRIEVERPALASTSHEVRRPWGSYQSLSRAEGWQVKRIRVRPGGKLSLQKHAHRSETWVVASGSALVTVDDVVQQLGPGQCVSIPVGAVHRLENLGSGYLELIEVQQGAYLGEDDIVRLSDIYGRSKEGLG